MNPITESISIIVDQFFPGILALYQTRWSEGGTMHLCVRVDGWVGGLGCYVSLNIRVARTCGWRHDKNGAMILTVYVFYLIIGMPLLTPDLPPILIFPP